MVWVSMLRWELFTRPRAVVLAAVVVLAVSQVGWLFSSPRPSAPLPTPPAVPSCTFDGRRQVTTLTLTLCIPPEAEMTTTPSVDLGITTVTIPNVHGPLVIVTGPYFLLLRRLGDVQLPS
jgi:hypothetical protein